MRWIWVFILLGSFSVVSAAQATCVAESQLSEGGYGRVTPGAANNVRAEPSRTAELVGEIPGGGLFEVIGDTECDDSYVWVEVAYGDFRGWTVEATASEYWVDPFDGAVFTESLIQFAYPEGYLDDVDSLFYPAEDRMGGSYPAMQRYTLEFPDNDIPFRWEIIVMHATAVTEDAPLADESLAKLRSLLRNQPDLTGPLLESVDPNQPQDDIFLPKDPLFLGARRMMIAAAHYVEMQGGRGVAFVTFYAQDLLPITNEDIFYNFLALTDDGEYFITARLPVRAPVLPDTYDDFVAENPAFPTNWAANYGGYRTNVTNELDALAPEDWEPNMDTLDSIVGSIQILHDFEAPGG